MIKKSRSTGADSLSASRRECFDKDGVADKAVVDELSSVYTPSAPPIYRPEAVTNTDKHSQVAPLSLQRHTTLFVAVAKGFLTVYFYWGEIDKLLMIERQEVVWEFIDPILAVLAMISSIVIWWLTESRKRQ
jgi:hypothetical protein